MQWWRLPIASQFTYAKTGQIITAIKEVGFYGVEEAALGADFVAYNEAEELQERELMTSSCCPAFVEYIKTKFPEMENTFRKTCRLWLKQESC